MNDPFSIPDTAHYLLYFRNNKYDNKEVTNGDTPTVTKGSQRDTSIHQGLSPIDAQAGDFAIIPPSSKAISSTDGSSKEGSLLESTSVKDETTSPTGATHVISPSDPLTAVSSDKEEVESEDEECSRSGKRNDESTILVEER